jgi:hypothetical protein
MSEPNTNLRQSLALNTKGNVGVGGKAAWPTILIGSNQDYALAWLDPLFTVELRLRCVGIQFERILRSLITGNEIGR